MAPADRSFARRTLLTTTAALTGAALLGGTAQAAGTRHTAWPAQFPLPDGFQPEGITIGPAPYAYFGSLANGDVYRASLATGRGTVVAKGAGRPTVGLKIDRHGRRLFLAGGDSGEIRTVDVRSGETEHVYATGGTFVNDVILTPGAAWFTDSFKPVLYRLAEGAVTTVPLTGDWQQGPDFTANGIERTPDGQALLVVNAYANGGGLMRVDPATGAARAVDLGTAKLPNGDGLLLLGRTLYAVQQQQNAIDVFRLNDSGTRGTAIARITDPRFRIPTTVAAWGKRLYLPNARFDVEPTPTTEYDAVAVNRV
ncbi:sugar lactone lactonase YvrE [Streptomyces sp. SAI-117]|uniref:SMP-30/gluconolactonase/LRE family protein n=1 Tax=unclassified Streptomyces TaxID=2593676 RepID=UPI0024761A6C|nr:MULTISPECIES: superoxide dismutase [unclassified Streptomyces]MDH6552454.1 sugar lactone lactonase YvrE [Streptomyces sp. SAI-041]MDH6571540.1 sugar lactone lactonase YvrE [Streptomyces sp. SAI-117]MDH6583498.1 sugar lactone lactonase YvrE [Streptomyces sp. SAI-133]